MAIFTLNQAIIRVSATMAHVIALLRWYDEHMTPALINNKHLVLDKYIKDKFKEHLKLPKREYTKYEEWGNGSDSF